MKTRTPPKNTHTLIQPFHARTLPELGMKHSCVTVNAADLATHLSWKKYSTSVPVRPFWVWRHILDTARIMRKLRRRESLLFLWHKGLSRSGATLVGRGISVAACWVKTEFRKTSPSLSVNKSVVGGLFTCPLPLHQQGPRGNRWTLQWRLHGYLSRCGTLPTHVLLRPLQIKTAKRVESCVLLHCFYTGIQEGTQCTKCKNEWALKTSIALLYVLCTLLTIAVAALGYKGKTGRSLKTLLHWSQKQLPICIIKHPSDAVCIVNNVQMNQLQRSNKFHMIWFLLLHAARRGTVSTVSFLSVKHEINVLRLCYIVIIYTLYQKWSHWSIPLSFYLHI